MAKRRPFKKVKPGEPIPVTARRPSRHNQRPNARLLHLPLLNLKALEEIKEFA